VITLRFQPRPISEPSNLSLAQAQSHADGLPTVMARWVKWLDESMPDEAETRQEVEAIRRVVVGAVPETVPNRDRMAENLALLLYSWEKAREFLTERGAIDASEAVELASMGTIRREAQEGLGFVATGLLEAVATTITAERPTGRFLETLISLIDMKQVHVVSRDKPADQTPMNVIGWSDEDGTVYLSSAAYDRVAQQMRMAGGDIGVSRNELYKLLGDEGLLAETSGAESTTVMRCQGKSRRVLALLPGVLELEAEGEIETETTGGGR